MNHRPVCVKCETEFRPEHNGVGLLDMFDPSDNPDPQPYQLWEADLYKCPKCGAEIVVGFAESPWVLHWQSEFQDRLTRKEAHDPVIRNYS